MSKVYKVHKWLSIISLIFFLMFCITGLVLMFRTELNAWAQGGTTHHSSAIMSMNEHEESIFKYADQGALLVKQKYPSKDILNISPAMGATHILRYRIIESTATVAPPARMGMGGDYVLYNPISKELITSHNEPPVHPWICGMLHTLHQLHTRLDLGKIGIYIVTFLSFLCSLTIISGIFLYGPFRKSYSKASVLSKKMKIGALHRELSIVATVWGFILCITGVWIGGFFIANDNYNADVLHNAKQELSIGQSEILQPSEAISRIMKVYPDRQVISMDYPSKFNNYHYAFYLVAEANGQGEKYKDYSGSMEKHAELLEKMSNKIMAYGSAELVKLFFDSYNDIQLKIQNGDDDFQALKPYFYSMPLIAVCIKYDLTGEKVNPSIFYNSCMQEVRILEVVKGMENFHEEMVLANNELVKKYHLSEDFLWK